MDGRVVTITVSLNYYWKGVVIFDLGATYEPPNASAFEYHIGPKADLIVGMMRAR